MPEEAAADEFLPVPTIRPRRLRQSPAWRRLVAETRLHPAELILPMFIREGVAEPVPIGSMPGQVQHSLDSFKAALHAAAEAGVGGVMLFGVPEESKKDATGSGADDPDGILNVATRIAVAEVGDALVVQTDLCLDEFTDHGHCGVLAADDSVDNDASLVRYRAMALAQAEAGSALLGLSGMMDGQVAAVRDVLDANGQESTAVLGYSAKYAGAFYGPFREAVGSSLKGDRKTYQQDPANHREGVYEAELDLAEGADIVLVKPASFFLDVLHEVAQLSRVPVWAYQVSGEYSMIEAAAARGWVDRDRLIADSLLSIRRAGADAVLTYWATEVAGWIRDGATLMSNDTEFDRAQAVIPGGVNSPVRAFRSVGGTPRFLSSAHGPYVVDVEGREYVDLVGSWGPALLGHAPAPVVEAVQAAAARGLSFGASTPGETDLAELVRERCMVDGWGEFQQIRLVSTGTEATMTAIRLARGATGRPLVVKFAGHYHGHSDGLLAEAGSGIATQGLPGSAGVPAEIAALTLVLPYNDLDAVRAAFDAHPGRIAAIITEAAGANAGVLAPEPGFNRALLGIAHEHGALLIVDEVLTGFRVGPAGWWGLEISAETGGGEAWIPDLVTFGKVIGGGLPLAAVAGREELMELLAPIGPVYQAGTLSGNPLAVAAGIAQLTAADTAVYQRIDASAARISAALEAAATDIGLPVTVSRAGSLFSMAFRDPANGPIRTYDDAKAQEAWRYGPFFAAMLEQGISLPPSVFEAWFLSSAHTDLELSRIEAALPAAFAAALAATA